MSNIMHPKQVRATYKQQRSTRGGQLANMSHVLKTSTMSPLQVRVWNRQLLSYMHIYIWACLYCIRQIILYKTETGVRFYFFFIFVYAGRPAVFRSVHPSIIHSSIHPSIDLSYIFIREYIRVYIYVYIRIYQ